MSQIWDITFRHESLPGSEWSPEIPPQIQVARQIHTVSTKVAGSSSTVTEIVSAENYRIRINGFVKTPAVEGIESREFPASTLKRLANLGAAKAAIEVSCEYLSLFGIRQIVFTSVNWNVQPGVPNEFRYAIVAISDEAPELQILRL